MIDVVLRAEQVAARRAILATTSRRWIRERLVERDGHRCFYCDRPLVGRSDIEHVIPRSRGGSDSEENLVLSCSPCNSEKGTTRPGWLMAMLKSLHPNAKTPPWAHWQPVSPAYQRIACASCGWPFSKASWSGSRLICRCGAVLARSSLQKDLNALPRSVARSVAERRR